MNFKNLFLLTILLLSGPLAFTQSMTLALEGDAWKDVKEYLVKGKNNFLKKEKLTFGDYHALEVDRSWTKGTHATSGLTIGVPTDDFYKKLITTDHIHKQQTLYFALGDDAGHQSKAFCLSRLDAKDFNIGNSPVSAFNLLLDLAGPGVSSTNVFYTKIFVGPSGQGYELLLDNQAAQTHPKNYIGYLAKNDDDYYSIVPSSKVKSKKGKVGKMPFGSAGFIISNKANEPLAAVSIIDNGVIYLKDIDPDERLLLATTCAVLLLRPADL
jgi:hypothetical protein